MSAKPTALLVSLSLLVFLNACTHKPGCRSIVNSEKWQAYVAAHTDGMISRKAQVRIKFTRDIVSPAEIRTPAAKLLRFEPGVKGAAEWAAADELVFTPRDGFAPGAVYTVTLYLDRRLELPKGLAPYKFQFAVYQRNLDLRIDGLSSDEQQENVLRLKGAVVTADDEDAALVEKTLAIRQDKTALNVLWEHRPESKEHIFTAVGLERRDTPSAVVLAWDGKPLEISWSGNREVPIPVIGKFEVLAAEAVTGDNPCVLVRFSDPLDARQNLDGLFRLGEETLRCSVESNSVKAYPASKLAGLAKLTVEPGVKNLHGKKLAAAYRADLIFPGIKPFIRFAGQGTVLPEGGKLTVPFETANIHSFQVTAFQIYASNMGQFLQVNNLNGDNELKRVGRYIWRKTIRLNATPAEIVKSTRYQLDLTELFEKYPDSLFRLTLSINRGNSAYKSDNVAPVKPEASYANDEDVYYHEASSWDYAEDYYGQNQSEENNWRHRDDPAYDAYYLYNRAQTESSRMFLASNLGLMAKMGPDHRLYAAVTDLRTAAPLGGVALSVRNFQNQEIGRAASDGNGLARIDLENPPFCLVAEYKGRKGYLKLNGNSTLPLSHFDVGGETLKGGVKGYVYGERGVWRPGDDIYLTFVLENKRNLLPPDHPVTLDLFNPQGQLVKSYAPEKSAGDFHAFHLKTAEDTSTGTWQAAVKLGGLTFQKSVKIETVAPNRLKVELDLGKPSLSKKDLPARAKLFGQWLHGAKASGLKTDVKLRLTGKAVNFTRFRDYEFNDPTRAFEPSQQVVYEGALNDEGRAEFDLDFPVEQSSPGMLEAAFTSRVFEEGGGYSTDICSLPFHPYRAYVGLKVPKGDQARNMLLTDKDHKVDICTVDDTGKPVSVKDLEVGIYKISWKWWWEKSDDSLAQFASDSAVHAIQSGTVSTQDGLGAWTFQIKYPDWGRYLIRVRDKKGGHCAGKIVYIDWPGWAGRAREEKGVGATRLNFTSDKPAYQAGEKAVIYLPSTVQGRALVSLETGSGILRQMWLETQKGENKFEIPLTAEMSPNIFVHVTLLQPHQDKKTDEPIRLYGVIPLLVNDPATRLDVELECPDVMRPLKTAAVKVREKNGRPMTYTLAVVDEGLLGLTRFMTPDLRSEFYKREALGVVTWDLFDFVIGGYGGELERILAIGGDEDGKDMKERENRRRFPPFVRFLGPFRLEAGKTAEHEIDVPEYFGAVRVMSVAGDQGAYGFAERTVPVKQNLMILPNLPRVIGTGETLSVPVSTFAMAPSVKQVRLEIAVNGRFQVVGAASQILNFKAPGEQLGFFRVKAGAKPGPGVLTLRAVSGKDRAEQSATLQVRAPNPETITLTGGVIEAGQSWSSDFKPHGLDGTNKVVLEASSIPAMGLEKRLDYLLRYPHGCIEQTTSSVFPQLYLPALAELTEKQKESLEKNVKAGIDRLRLFQTTGGGFVYWPGASGEPDAWGTNYAGHFLVEASKHGYYVSPDMLAKWVKYQKTAANAWREGSQGRSDLTQAYRLFLLALAGQPDLGAMNRLREMQLSKAALWQLATAFQWVGQQEAAAELMAKAADFKVEAYQELGNTYGSDRRDKAMILYALAVGEKRREAFPLAEELSKILNADAWCSTQETAYMLMAVARYVGAERHEKISLAVSLDGGTGKTVASDAPVTRHTLDGYPAQGAKVTVANRGKSVCYVTLLCKGIPPAGEEKEAANGLSLNVVHRLSAGVPAEGAELKQGADYQALVTVRNTSDRKYENLVLTQVVPSGVQIRNQRLEGGVERSGRFDYQDIRDDRVFTYFSLGPGQTREFEIQLNASYAGDFYQPGLQAEAMYNAKINASTAGRWIRIVK